MITSVLETLSYRLALRRVQKRAVDSLPGALSQRQLLLVLPQQKYLIDPVLTLVDQIELPADQIKLLRIGDDELSDSSVDPYEIRQVGTGEFDWFRLPSSAVCREVYTPKPHVAIDLNTRFVLPAAYIVARSPAPFRIGIHHPEAEPFRDILLRYDGEEKEAYLALRRILYTIEPAILPMQPMSTRVFY